MSEDIVNFKHWPNHDFGDPIFTCTEDAIFYAHLIADSFAQVSLLVGARHKFLEDLQLYRSAVNPDLQAFHDLAVRCQLLRECIYEVIRIRKNV